MDEWCMDELMDEWMDEGWMGGVVAISLTDIASLVQMRFLNAKSTQDRDIFG